MTAPTIGRCIGTHAGLNKGVFVKCANFANRHRAGHADIQPALYIDGAGVPQCINFIAGLQAEQPSVSIAGPMPSAADVRFVGPAPVVSSAAFRERAALPGAAMPRAFSSEA